MHCITTRRIIVHAQRHVFLRLNVIYKSSSKSLYYTYPNTSELYRSDNSILGHRTADNHDYTELRRTWFSYSAKLQNHCRIVSYGRSSTLFTDWCTHSAVQEVGTFCQRITRISCNSIRYGNMAERRRGVGSVRERQGKC
jgi:hypothetical protein